jgi:hypothetical protein
MEAPFLNDVRKLTLNDGRLRAGQIVPDSDRASPNGHDHHLWIGSVTFMFIAHQRTLIDVMINEPWANRLPRFSRDQISNHMSTLCDFPK